MFSDEKKFTVDGSFNKKNGVVYAKNRAEADKNEGLYHSQKYPVSCMVWVGLTQNGPTEPYLIEGRMDQDYYWNKVLPFAKRQGLTLFGNNKWIFQQDGATSHTGDRAMGFCRRNSHQLIDESNISLVYLNQLLLLVERRQVLIRRIISWVKIK